MFVWIKRGGVLAACVLSAVLSSGDRLAAGSLLIWPIDPAIESHERATALWLENTGAKPMTLQVRVFRWTTLNYEDHYVDQSDGIVGSPPIVSIEPGKRQLVRLTRLQPPEPGRQLAYRILIDELPSPPTADAAARGNLVNASMGVTLRMRYSLPLFVYGEGLIRATRQPPASASRGSAAPLEWRIVEENGRRWLHVRNPGPVHARLSRVRLIDGAADLEIARGLLGYVLPGAERRWSLPDAIGVDAGEDAVLVADVNGRTAVRIAGG